MASEIEVRQFLVGKFPGLGQSPFEITSAQDRSYNCIAWAAGQSQKFWWPGFPDWPSPNRKVTRANFIRVFQKLGYDVCDNPEPEDGFEKIALYEKDGSPTHAARLLADGKWTSKLGQSNDISHSLNALNGDQYGEPTIFLRRALSEE